MHIKTNKSQYNKTIVQGTKTYAFVEDTKTVEEKIESLEIAIFQVNKRLDNFMEEIMLNNDLRLRRVLKDENTMV